ARGQRTSRVAHAASCLRTIAERSTALIPLQPSLVRSSYAAQGKRLVLVFPGNDSGLEITTPFDPKNRAGGTRCCEHCEARRGRSAPARRPWSQAWRCSHAPNTQETFLTTRATWPTRTPQRARRVNRESATCEPAGRESPRKS